MNSSSLDNLSTLTAPELLEWSAVQLFNQYFAVGIYSAVFKSIDVNVINKIALPARMLYPSATKYLKRGTKTYFI